MSAIRRAKERPNRIKIIVILNQCDLINRFSLLERDRYPGFKRKCADAQQLENLMLNRLVPNVTFKTRVRDESISGPNPFRWQDVTSAEVFSGRRIVVFALPGAFTPYFQRLLRIARPICDSLIWTKTSCCQSTFSRLTSGKIECPCISGGTGIPAASSNVGGISTGSNFRDRIVCTRHCGS